MSSSLSPIDAPAPRVNSGLLHALVSEGFITPSQSDGAALFAKRRMLHVEEALLQMGTLAESVLLKFQANYYRTQFVSTQKLARAPISASLLSLIPHKLAIKHTVFPVKYDPRQGVLSILTVEPDDLEVLKNVQFATRVPKVRALVARPAAIAAAIKVHYEDELQAFGNIRATGPLLGASDRPRRTVQTSDHQSFAPPTASYHPEDSVVGATNPTLDSNMASMYGAEAPTATAPMVPVEAPLPAPPRTVPIPASLERHVGTSPFGQGHTVVATAPAGVASTAAMPPAGVVPVAMPVASPAGIATLHEVSAPLTAATSTSSTPQVAVHDYLETLNVMVALLETERGELRNHSVMVARLCRRFCERLGINPSEADAVIVAAYLHDIGKSSAFHLTALNAAQYEQHQIQARKSYLTPVRIFESVRLPEGVVPVLSHLYERFDGQGFPDRQNGKEICLGSRVLAIVETYCDLTGHASNPFRRKLSPSEAWEAIAKFKGKIFDPNLVDIFKLVVLGDDLRAKLLADRRRALIVDPDAEETTVLELRLSERGYEVTIARNAAEALNELTQDFDVVISEVELAPMDGFALLSKVRSNGVTVPFVFLSRRAESDTVQQAFDLGADEFISKPASSEVVALKVSRVLDGAGRKRKTGGVSGSLTEMALPDVVQILFHGRKSGRLAIESGGRKGEILFSEGQIFEAAFGELRNEEAFYEMLCLKEGDFELDPNVVPSERKISLSPESMLLEGLRRLDEAGR